MLIQRGALTCFITVWPQNDNIFIASNAELKCYGKSEMGLQGT